MQKYNPNLVRHIFFQALRQAIFYEQELGTIQTHYASYYSNFSATVKEIEANLDTTAGHLVFTDESISIS